MNINDILKSLRKSKGLTQADMSIQLGISLSAYQKYERDKNSVIPSLDVLIRIADFYHVSVDYLLGRDTGEPSPLDKLTTEFNMSALERKIVDNYLSMPPSMRGDLMEFLQKSVREVMENGD